MQSAESGKRGGFRLSPELWLITLAAIVLGAFILVPRASRAVAWPMPHVDFGELQALTRRNAERHVERAGRPLSRKLLRVGERLRRVGSALYQGPLPVGMELGYRRQGYGDAKAALIEAVAQLKAADREEFCELVTIQTSLFVRAVRSFQATGQVSRDLVELGGDFATSASVAFSDETGRLPFSDEELGLLYRVRLAHLTETEDAPEFQPSRDELLAYYALFLAHPPRDVSQRSLARHAAIQAISALDAKYPADFAHGLADLELGSFESAAAALLAAKENGSWAKLRQNGLLAARQGLME